MNFAGDAPTEPAGVQPRGCFAGQVVAGKYRLVTELGRGGMGVVWKAERLSRRRDFAAIKLMAPNLQGFALARKRFEREVALAASVRGPHVVYVFDDGIDEKTGQLFIVMELLDGESVGRRLHQLKRLSPGEVMLLVKHVSRALTAIHKAGVVHRDLKPDNIYLTGNDEDPLFKILDFGLAKQIEIEDSDSLELCIDSRALTVEGNALGTPWYMSPEHLRGESPEPRGDVWSLAIIAYECLVGQRPFDATDIATLGAQLLSADRPVPSRFARVPPGFDAWFAKATHRDPERRFQTAKELETALQAVCGAYPRDMPPIQFGLQDAGRAPTLAAVTHQPEARPSLRSRSRMSTAKVVAFALATLTVAGGIEAYVFWPRLTSSVVPAVTLPLVTAAAPASPSEHTARSESVETAIAAPVSSTANPAATAASSSGFAAGIPAAPATAPLAAKSSVEASTQPVRTSKKRARPGAKRPSPRPTEDGSRPSIVEMDDNRSQPSIVETGYR